MSVVVEKRNSELYLRPRFSMELSESSEVVLARFKAAFKKEETVYKGSIVDGHVFIRIPKKTAHFWSPQLHLESIEKTTTTSELKGLFGPKPQVWTLFMFIHFVVGTLFLGFAVLLYTRLILNETVLLPAAMLIVLPLLWFVLYFVGKIGKSTGKTQMKELHNFMIKTLEI